MQRSTAKYFIGGALLQAKFNGILIFIACTVTSDAEIEIKHSERPEGGSCEELL